MRITVIFLHGTLVSFAPLWMTGVDARVEEMTAELVWKNMTAASVMLFFLDPISTLSELHTI